MRATSRPFWGRFIKSTNFVEISRKKWIRLFGDPILILQNNPKQQLYNGTTGILIRKSGVGTAYFSTEDGVRTIAEKALPLFEVAFCLSIHKSQGSEFEEVLILLGPGSERFGKAALYTGVTRAKKKVEICAEESAFLAALVKKTSFNSGFWDRFHD